MQIKKVSNQDKKEIIEKHETEISSIKDEMNKLKEIISLMENKIAETRNSSRNAPINADLACFKIFLKHAKYELSICPIYAQCIPKI